MKKAIENSLQYSEIIKTLKADVLVEDTNPNRKMHAVISSDLISDILTFLEEDALLLTGLVNTQVIRVAEMIDIGSIILVRGKKPERPMIEMAREKNVPLATTNHTLYEASGKLYKRGLKSCTYNREG